MPGQARGDSPQEMTSSGCFIGWNKNGGACQGSAGSSLSDRANDQFTLTALQAAATALSSALPVPKRSVAALSVAVRAPE
jgi:hypothetical protein